MSFGQIMGLFVLGGIALGAVYLFGWNRGFSECEEIVFKESPSATSDVCTYDNDRAPTQAP